MRDMEAIRSALGAAQDAYLKAVEESPEKVWRPLSDQVVELTQELSAAIAEGASPCPDCGNLPHGLRHIRGLNAGGIQFIHTFEVGCLVCPDHKAVGSTPPEPDGADLVQHAEAARTLSVTRWNNGQYLPPKTEA